MGCTRIKPDANLTQSVHPFLPLNVEASVDAIKFILFGEGFGLVQRRHKKQWFAPYSYSCAFMDQEI
jgi:hypothetical protein